MGDDKYKLGKLKWVKFYDSETGELLFSNDFNSSISDMEVERRENMTEEILIELKEKLETMQNAIYEAINDIDDEINNVCLETDRNLDLKVIVRLNRVETELNDCFEMIIEESL